MSPGSASASGHSLLVLTFVLECWGLPTVLSVLFCQAFYQAPGWAAVGVEGGAKQPSQLPECTTSKALSHAQILFCVFVSHCFSGLQNQGNFLLGHLARVSGTRMDVLQTARQSWHTCTKMSFCRACGTTLVIHLLACARPWMPSPALKISDGKEINIIETCEITIHWIINHT